jgi:hypothetical protein
LINDRGKKESGEYVGKEAGEAKGESARVPEEKIGGEREQGKTISMK